MPLSTDSMHKFCTKYVGITLGFCIAVLAPFAVAHAAEPTTQPGIRVGRIQSDRISESSGVVASRRHPGILWTLNDSGNSPSLFAMKEDGTVVGEWRVKRTNRDWEDLAIDDEGHLYIGEIGNNFGRFGQLAVYRVDEPDPAVAPDPRKPLLVTNEWHFRFPNRSFDIESLFVWKGKAYVISKNLNQKPAEIYSIDLANREGFQILKKVATLHITMPVTGADLSPDGTSLAVATPLGVHLLTVNGDIATAEGQNSRLVVFVEPSMEAVCFLENDVLATSEKQKVIRFDRSLFGQPTTKPATSGPAR